MAQSEKGHQGVTEDKKKDYIKIFVFIICIAFVILLSLFIGSRLGIKYYTTHYNVLSSQTNTDNNASTVQSNTDNENSVNDVLPSSNNEASSESKNSSAVSSQTSGNNIGSGQFTAYINTNSKTFHLDKNCQHYKKIKEENLMEFHYDSVQEIIDSGYKACGTCAAEYK